MALRLNMLMTHYRQPLNFTSIRLDEAAKMWRRWRERAVDGGSSVPSEVLAALSDDLNTPLAIMAASRSLAICRDRRGKGVPSQRRARRIALPPTAAE